MEFFLRGEDPQDQTISHHGSNKEKNVNYAQKEVDGGLRLRVHQPMFLDVNQIFRT